MTCITIVLLNGNGVLFADNVPIFREYSRKSVPIIRVKDSLFTMFQFFVEPSDRCRISSACNPRNCSSASTINDFKDPQFVFFEPMKCHNKLNEPSAAPVNLAVATQQAPQGRSETHFVNLNLSNISINDRLLNP
jgi:hypothetical protein